MVLVGSDTWVFWSTVVYVLSSTARLVGAGTASDVIRPSCCSLDAQGVGEPLKLQHLQGCAKECSAWDFKRVSENRLGKLGTCDSRMLGTWKTMWEQELYEQADIEYIAGFRTTRQQSLDSLLDVRLATEKQGTVLRAAVFGSPAMALSSG